MARVLIYEPSEDIRALLTLVVARLGHESLVVGPGAEVDDDLDADAAILEPGAPGALELAAVLARRDVTLLFASIYPADADMLALAPAAYLVKPFTLCALETALRDTVPVPVRT